MFGKNLKLLRKTLGYNQKQFADLLHISQGFLSDLENGNKESSYSLLISINEKTNADPTWLITGEGEMFNSSIPVREATEKDEMITLPFFSDVFASAGNGYVVAAENQQTLAFDPVIMNRIKGTNIQCIRVDGDSMAPKYSKNDILLVDLNHTALTHEGIYVVRLADTLLVKHLQRIPKGVRLCSLNTVYKDVEITEYDYEQDEFGIIGLVVGAVTFN